MQKLFMVLKILYCVGFVILGYFAVHDFIEQVTPSRDSYERRERLFRECYKEVNPDAESDWELFSGNEPSTSCLEKIVTPDFMTVDIQRMLVERYGIIAYSNIAVSTKIIAFIKALYYLLRVLIISLHPIPIFLLFALVGGYIWAYDKIPDLYERFLEGLISGVMVSSLMVYANTFFIEKANDWGETTHIEVPPEALFLIVTVAFIWLGFDVYKRNIDHLFVKIVLFVSGLVFFVIFPKEFDVRLIVTPIITLALSVVYYYWQKIDSKRKKIGVLVYSTATIGILAAFMKHSLLFLGGGLIINYSWSDLGELVLDFIVFILGFLITFLELSKEPSEVEHATEGNMPKELNTELLVESKSHDTKQFSSLAVFMFVFLFGVGVKYLKDLLSTKKKV